MKAPPKFWEYLDDVVASHTIVVDRPKGSPHPVYPDAVYPVDYGYLAETASMDSSGIDVWIGSTGFTQVDGVMCSVDIDKNDIEIKVLLSCTDDEMEQIYELINTGQQASVLIRRQK